MNSFLEENKVFEIQSLFPECTGWRRNIIGNEGELDESATIILESLKCKGEKFYFQIYLLEFIYLVERKKTTIT